MKSIPGDWKGLLGEIYSQKDAWLIAAEVEKLLARFKRRRNGTRNHLAREPFPGGDIALVTYANSIEDLRGAEPSLFVLRRFLQEFKLFNVFSLVHLLPFYPWDTDRGFSVKDYYRVDPAYGSWKHINQLHKRTALMFDFVVNHASIDNPLVQGALIARHLASRDKRCKRYERYRDFVLAYTEQRKPSSKELMKLVRPRPFPVLTPYCIVERGHALKAKLGKPGKDDNVIGQGWVWTTFSRAKENEREVTKQVDLNFANPRVFVEALKIMLFYAARGANILRLDAIPYTWKKLGSASIHEPEIHTLLRAFSGIMRDNGVPLKTLAEVNEPQVNFLPYLGTKERPEADLVYQFVHFPLAVHALTAGTAFYYRKWLKTLAGYEGKFFTPILGTHDGMGLKALRALLPERELTRFITRLIRERHALPNYSRLAGGKQIIYELCGTPWNLINGTQRKEALHVALERYRAVLALGLLPRGIPALYINGLLGAENYTPQGGLDEHRTVNRQIFDEEALTTALSNRRSRMHRVMRMVTDLIRIRSQETAFARDAKPLEILGGASPAVLAVRLENRAGTEIIVALSNVTDEPQTIAIPYVSASMRDLLSPLRIAVKNKTLHFRLKPYQVAWLKHL